MTQRKTLQTLSAKLLANGKVEGHEIKLLREYFSEDGEVDQKEAELLLELYLRSEQMAPGFEKFFFSTIKKYLLSDECLSREKVIWLRKVVLFDGAIGHREKQLLRELRGEASEISDEAKALFEECGV